MFIDYTSQEKNRFLSQNEGYLIPGYTGHCPTLRFRIGKRYGVNTRDIIREFSNHGAISQDFRLYSNSDRDSKLNRNVSLVSFPKVRHREKRDVEKENMSHNRKYILGYTGYIPGMYYRYGKSFCSIADDCEKEFSCRSLATSKKPTQIQIKDLSKIPTRIPTTGSQGPQRVFKECNKISPEFPPISGYTGHIPCLKISSLSISQPYQNAAKLGLSLLKKNTEAIEK